VADIAALARVVVDGRDGSSGPTTRRRLAGVITGKALVDGRMTVEEGLVACAPSG
jgi:phosphoribosylformimino-5-aminoimidazole carboxamide ribonucleotide (ProFAR) isomerase